MVPKTTLEVLVLDLNILLDWRITLNPDQGIITLHNSQVAQHKFKL